MEITDLREKGKPEKIEAFETLKTPALSNLFRDWRDREWKELNLNAEILRTVSIDMTVEHSSPLVFKSYAAVSL